jgi:hypothetical protein
MTKSRPGPTVHRVDRTHNAFSPGRRDTLVSLYNGLSVALRLTTGKVVVGDIDSATPQTVLIRPWGVGSLLRVPTRRIAASRVVGAHSWADARTVGQRQRQGLSAVSEPSEGKAEAQPTSNDYDAFDASDLDFIGAPVAEFANNEPKQKAARSSE